MAPADANTRLALTAPAERTTVAAAAGFAVLLVLAGSYFGHPGIALGIVAILGVLGLSFVNARAGLLLLLIVGAFSNIISILASAGDFGGQALGFGALLRDMVLLAVLAGWLLRSILAGKRIYVPVIYPLAYMVVILAFVFLAPSRMTALLEFRNAAFYIVILYVTADAFTSKRQLKTALAVVAFLATVVALFGIVQPATNAAVLERLGFYEEMTGFGQHIVCHYPYPYSSFARATAAIDTPIIFGTYMVLHLFILGAARRFYGGRMARKVALLALLLVVTAIILSLSRTAWYSLLAALATMGVLTRRYRLMLLSISVVLVVFVAARFGVGRTMAGRFFSTGEVEQGSNQGRIKDIEDALSAMKGQYALGLGLGSQGSAKTRFSEAYRKAGVYEIVTDNYYLQMLAETGVVGLAAYLLLLVLLIRRGMAIQRRTRDPQLKSLAGAVVLAIFVCFFANATSSVFASRIFVHYFWFLIGVVFAIQRIDRTAGSNV